MANSRQILKRIPGAAWFDGVGSIIDLGNLGPIAQAKSSFTFLIFVKRLVNGGIMAPIGDQKPSSTFTSFNLGLNTSNRAISNVGNATASNTVFQASGTPSFPLFQWVHMGLSYDGTNSRGYRAGFLDRTVPLVGGGAVSVATGNMRFGNAYSQTRAWIGGLCRAMYFHNVVKTNDQILDIALGAEDSATLAGITNYWPLYTDAIDIVGGNNGVISGGVTFSSVDVPLGDRIIL